MTMSKPTREIIIVSESVLASWMRDAGSIGALFGLMGAGVYLESSAMQWFGGFIGVFWLIAKQGSKKMTYDIPGARKRLDELEAE